MGGACCGRYTSSQAGQPSVVYEPKRLKTSSAANKVEEYFESYYPKIAEKNEQRRESAAAAAGAKLSAADRRRYLKPKRDSMRYSASGRRLSVHEEELRQQSLQVILAQREISPWDKVRARRSSLPSLEVDKKVVPPKQLPRRKSDSDVVVAAGLRRRSVEGLRTSPRGEVNYISSVSPEKLDTRQVR